MHQDFYKNKKKETIILSNLSNLNGYRFSEFFSSGRLRYEKEKNDCLGLYDVDNKKSKELETTFKQLKLKIFFKYEPKILRNGKFYTISQGCFNIYNDKLFNKLYEIKFDNDNNNKSTAIQLDNNDLVLLSGNQIFIFRLKDGKYSLLQKIEEDKRGFKLQYSYSECEGYPKSYKVNFIKEISGNRFICVSNYGFKIYFLNEKNLYSIILLNKHYESIEMIHEISENKFIFCSNLYCGDSLVGSEHNILLIDLITLKGITKDVIDKKLQELTEYDVYNYNEDDNYFSFNKKKNEKITDINEIKKLIKSLKLTSKCNTIFEYSTYGEFHNFHGYVIIKNKFFIIMIDNYINIFNLFNGNNLKTYEILIDGEDNLYKAKMEIKKWNNKEDNEFFLFENGNIVLFELKEEQTKEIKLKIINQSYFPGITNIEKLSKKNNKFYAKSKLDDIEKIIFFGNEQIIKIKEKNENRFSISIF